MFVVSTRQDPAQAASSYTNTIQKTENFSREEEDIAPDLEVDMWCEEEGGRVRKLGSAIYPLLCAVTTA